MGIVEYRKQAMQIIAQIYSDTLLDEGEAKSLLEELKEEIEMRIDAIGE